MKKRVHTNWVMLVLMTCLAPVAMAQQQPWINTAYENPYLTNPSLAGYNNRSSVYFMHQNSMVQFQGAPTTQLFFWEGALKEESMGLGIRFRTDRANFIRTTSGLLSYSYMVRLGEQSDLRFGLSAGVLQQSILFDQIQAAKPTETIILNANQSAPSIDSELGLSYVFQDELVVGASAQHLLGNKLLFTDALGQENLDFQLLRHYRFFAMYTHSFSDDFALRPIVNGIGVEGTPFRVQAGVHGIYRDMIHVGASYKTTKTLNVVAGLRLQDRFSINYSFDYGVDRAAALPITTHEILLGYSFSNIGRPVAPATKRTQPESKKKGKLSDTDQEQFEEIDRLGEGQKQIRTELEQQKRRLDSHEKELEKLKNITQGYSTEIEALVERSMLDILNDTTLSVGEKVKKGEEEKPRVEKAYFAVMGAFKNFNPAKRYEQVLKKSLQTETHILLNRTNTFYLVAVRKIEDEKEAFKELKKLRSDPEYLDLVAGGNIWLYLQRRAAD